MNLLLRRSIMLYLTIILVISSVVLLSEASSSVKKVYSTNFESVTKKNLLSLDMGIENLFVFDDSIASMFMDDGYKRPNSPVPHSGSRDVCLEITKGYRNEFNLMNMQNLVNNELFVSVWLYLPTNFQMHMQNSSWFEIADPLVTAETFAPYFALHINQDTEQSNFGMELYQRDLNHEASVLKDIPSIDLPRGRWFNLQYYVYRDTTKGAIKIWFDDPLMQNPPIIDVKGLQMINPSAAAWYTTIAKIYHDPNDTYSPYQLWVDDLEVWNGIPIQRLNINAWTDKGDNSQLPVYWGCLGSYKKGDTLALHYSLNKDCQGKIEITDPAGSVKTLVNGPLSQGTFSLNLLLNGPTGYWHADCSVFTNNESNVDSFQFCVVQDYVKFRGSLLSASKSAASGNFYQVKVTDVISDPTGAIHTGESIQVHWNYSLTTNDNGLDEGSYVEVYGGYIPSTVGGFNEAIVLANPDDYIKWVATYSVSIDPNGGRIYIDDSPQPITIRSTYDWLEGSAHKLYAIPAFESQNGRFIFSKWMDGNTENPRVTKVNGSSNYTAFWVQLTSAASISILSPSNRTFAVNSIDLTLSLNVPVTWIGYSLDNTDNISTTGNTTLQGLTEGPHSITVYAKDYFGNMINSSSIHFVIDTRNAVGNLVTVVALIIIAVCVAASVIFGFKVPQKLNRLFKGLKR